MPTFKTLDDIEVSGKRVLLRVDLNVPMDEGRVSDTTRIERIRPTIDEIARRGGKTILLSHFDRPKGKIVPSMSLEPIVATLSNVLGCRVAFASNCIGPLAAAAVSKLDAGDVLLLENTRFHEGEENNDPAFVSALAANGDIFVADAFSCAHRAHASTVGIATKLPSFAGRTMQAELEALEAGLGNPERPVVAIVGGAKVSTKLELLKNLVKKVDCLIIGGAMANTFLAADGINVGKSLCEQDLAETALYILSQAKKAGCEIILPVDGVVTRQFKANADNQTVDISAIPPDTMMLDIGPKSIERVNAAIKKAKTLVWNGPFGAFEITPFDRATVATAQFAAKRTKSGNLISIAGGGDTVAAMVHAGVSKDLTYLSTAGGAFLEWTEGKELPGVAVLTRG